jgi:hypothetical protein
LYTLALALALAQLGLLLIDLLFLDHFELLYHDLELAAAVAP